MKIPYILVSAALLVTACDIKPTDNSPKGEGSGDAKSDKDSAAEPTQAKSNATIKFNKVEDSMPATDTGVKYNVSLEGEEGPIVSEATATLTVKYKDGDKDESLLVATETDDGSNWSKEDNPFPGHVGKDWNFAGSVYMDDDKAKEVQKLFANKDKNDFKLILQVSLKTTGGSVEPIEREIKLN